MDLNKKNRFSTLAKIEEHLARKYEDYEELDVTEDMYLKAVTHYCTSKLEVSGVFVMWLLLYFKILKLDIIHLLAKLRLRFYRTLN